MFIKTTGKGCVATISGIAFSLAISDLIATEVQDLPGISLKRLILGQPIPSHKAHQQRLGKLLALPVFASDALSSSAYGTQEIILMLALAGAAGMRLTLWISVGILALLAIVVASYSQTVHAYPKGGGSYTVSKENLSVGMGLLAAAALLCDYVLTVAVSIAAGVQQIVSFAPSLAHQTSLLCLIAILFITLANLRGAKESGALFSIPTYFFVAAMFAMILTAIIGPRFGFAPMPLGQSPPSTPLHGIGLFLVLKAFASGCATLTGTEAISNGVQAFRAPEARNAAITLALMGIILGALFFGISYIVQTYHIYYYAGMDQESVISLVARSVFHDNHLLRGAVLLGTTLILILAANTSFADFPRLSAILAGDGFLPRQLSNLGDKLVFSNGIVLLGILSSVLVVAFGGHTDRLIPLYAVGVFLAFTLSQTGMVRRWFRLKTKGWQLSASLNGIGAAATGIVLVIILIEKFVHGAWIVVVVIPIIVFMFSRIDAHYKFVAKRLSLEGRHSQPKRELLTIVLVSGIHRGIMPACMYARGLGGDVCAVHIAWENARAEDLIKSWRKWVHDIPLHVIPRNGRSLDAPIAEFIRTKRAERTNCMISVLIPELVIPGIAGRLLHNNTAFYIRRALSGIRDIAVSSIKCFVE